MSFCATWVYKFRRLLHLFYVINPLSNRGVFSVKPNRLHPYLRQSLVPHLAQVTHYPRLCIM